MVDFCSKFRRLPLGPNVRGESRSFHALSVRVSITAATVCFFSAIPPGQAFADPVEGAHESHEIHKSHGDDDGEDITRLDTIFVTASPLLHSQDELALPIDVLDRAEVLDHLGSTIGETLRHSPGVTVSGFTAGASRPVIRGQDAFRVRVLEDGLGVGDVSDLSPDHAIPTNPLMAERIEVLRGPATLRYGGGAIGGVVNTVTERIPTEAADEAIGGRLFQGYNTVSNQYDTAARLDAATGPVAWHFDAYYRDGDDYEIPGSPNEQVSTFNEAQAFSGAGSWFGDAGHLGVAFTQTDNEYGIPAPEDPTDPVHVEMQRDRWAFSSAWNDPFGLVHELRVQGAYTDYEHDEVSRSSGPAAHFENEEFEGRVELLHEPVAGSLHGALGVHVRTADVLAGGEAEELLAPAQTRTYAGYLFEEFPLGELFILQVGARVESTTVEGMTSGGTQRDRDFVPISASTTLEYFATDDVVIGLTTSASQRAPSPLELFAMGPHEASATFERGNADLDEETSFTADLNTKGTFGALQLETSLFYTHYNDFVYGRFTGRTCSEEGDCVVGDGEELDELVYTSDDAQFYGFEVRGIADLLKLDCGTIGLDSQIDFVRARLDQGGNVPRIPPLRWGGGLFFENAKFRTRLGFLRNEKQDKTSDQETNTSGFTMLEASARYRLELGEGKFPVDLLVAADNLLDEKARNHVSFLKNDVLMPGRSVRFGIEASF